VLASALLVVSYPHLPIEPGTLAGRVYYLRESLGVLGKFTGMGMGAGTGTEKGGGLGLSCRGRRGGELEVERASSRRYRLGEMVGCVSGRRRLGVFVVDESGDGGGGGGENGGVRTRRCKNVMRE